MDPHTQQSLCLPFQPSYALLVPLLGLTAALLLYPLHLTFPPVQAGVLVTSPGANSDTIPFNVTVTVQLLGGSPLVLLSANTTTVTLGGGMSQQEVGTCRNCIIYTSIFLPQPDGSVQPCSVSVMSQGCSVLRTLESVVSTYKSCRLRGHWGLMPKENCIVLS